MSKKESPILEEHNWFIGEDKIFVFLAYDEADNPLTIPNDWTFEWVIRDNSSAEEALLTVPDAGITVVSSVNGADTALSVSVNGDDTLALMEPGVSFHTLRRTNVGFRNVISYGPAVIRYAASR